MNHFEGTPRGHHEVPASPLTLKEQAILANMKRPGMKATDVMTMFFQVKGARHAEVLANPEIQDAARNLVVRETAAGRTEAAKILVQYFNI